MLVFWAGGGASGTEAVAFVVSPCDVSWGSSLRSKAFGAEAEGLDNVGFGASGLAFEEDGALMAGGSLSVGFAVLSADGFSPAIVTSVSAVISIELAPVDVAEVEDNFCSHIGFISTPFKSILVSAFGSPNKYFCSDLI